MIRNEDGSIEFDNGRLTFIFRADNLRPHVQKRPKLAYERFLKEIEETLLDPDCITSGPKKQKRTYYKVSHYQDVRGQRFVTYWKVPVFLEGRGRAAIATCIDQHSPIDYAIHYLETVIWKSPNSKL